MNLTTSDVNLIGFLRVCHSAKLKLKQITAILMRSGYSSKTGEPLTESQISNFYRKDLDIRFMVKHEKPNYKGKNWISSNKENGKPTKRLSQRATV